MRLVRLATCTALAGSLLVVGTGHAAVKPVCNLVTDAAGDAKQVNAQPPVPATTLPAGSSDDAFDITSLDVATDKSVVTGVIRVKALSASSQYAPMGSSWFVSFAVDGATLTLGAHASATGTITYDGSYASATGGSLYPGALTGAFDKVKNEVRITAPLSLFAAQATIKSGTKLTAISGAAGQEVAVPEATGAFGGGTFFSDANSTDNAGGGQDYVAGTKSCVIPGK